MAIKRQDEVLAKAVASDATVIPRYDIKRPDGTKVAENVALELKNTVVNEGTPIDKNLLDELLAASGTAGGTASALTLAQDGFVLADGAVVRCKITADLAPNAALDVNGTGAKYLYTSTGEKFAAGIKAGVWLLLIYSSTLDGYVIVNKTNAVKTKTEIFTVSGQWTAPAGVTSAYVLVYGAGGHGGSSGTSGGAAGGGGGHMKAQTVTVEPGRAYPVTIGTAGSGTGGASSFGTLLSANGGGKGGNGSGSTGGNGGNGGSGGGAGGAGYYGKPGTGGTGSNGGNGGNGGTANVSSGKGVNGGNGTAVADVGNGTGGTGGAGATNGYGVTGGGGGGGGYGGNGRNGGKGTVDVLESGIYASGGRGGGGGGYGNYGRGGDGTASGTNGIVIVTYTVEEG